MRIGWTVLCTLGLAVASAAGVPGALRYGAPGCRHYSSSMGCVAKTWLRRSDLNRRPAGYEPAALPTAPRRSIVIAQKKSPWFPRGLPRSIRREEFRSCLADLSLRETLSRQHGPRNPYSTSRAKMSQWIWSPSFVTPLFFARNLPLSACTIHIPVSGKALQSRIAIASLMVGSSMRVMVARQHGPRNPLSALSDPQNLTPAGRTNS